MSPHRQGMFFETDPSVNQGLAIFVAAGNEPHQELDLCREEIIVGIVVDALLTAGAADGLFRLFAATAADSNRSIVDDASAMIVVI